MFDQALTNLGDNLNNLFNLDGKTIGTLVGRAGQGYSSGSDTSISKIAGIQKVENRLYQGVVSPSNNKTDVGKENSPTKTQPAATVDPQEEEAKWMARLAKYAGLSQSTGVKLGGL